MSFLNQMSPEDADPFDEPEETDDTDSTDDGEKELRGVEKQIDSLLKDAECDASLTTKFSGTITMLIGRVHDREEDAENDLFRAVCEQLRQTALISLANFRRLQIEPAELISEIYPRLLSRLLKEEFNDRQHFFATACMHFRWAIGTELKKLKKERLRTEPMALALPGDQTGPAEMAERDDLYSSLSEAIDQLPERSKEIINYRFHLGYGFREIAGETGNPRATIYDDYRKALKELKNLLGDGFEDTGT